MRPAPAARWVVRTPRAWELLLAGLNALAAAAVLAGLSAHLVADPFLLGGLASAAGIGAFEWSRRRPRSKPVTIVWDGAAWSMDPDEAGGATLARLEVMVDLDRFLLLRATTAEARRRVRWLAVSLSGDRIAVRALCAALYGTAPAAAQG